MPPPAESYPKRASETFSNLENEMQRANIFWPAPPLTVAVFPGICPDFIVAQYNKCYSEFDRVS
jgi:hypothetical protein